MDWIKGFCKAKETINKTTKCTKWEKIVANDMLSKGLIPKYINSTCNSTCKIQTTQLKNGQKPWKDSLQTKIK